MEHDKLYKIRHSLAHLLAMATIDTYPQAKLAIGPVIENGFYYDIDFGDEKIGEEHLKELQKKMKKMASQSLPFTQVDMSELEAREYFKDNEYKLELINEIIARDDLLTFYRTGDTFIDLCAGGHIDNTSEISTDAFRLERVAGAYWRGDENKPMLTRIYGVAFESKESLASYDEMMREAKKRDHRKLGRELDLFTFSDMVGAGLPLFTPRGTLLRNGIINRIWDIQKQYGWEYITTPHITKQALYETSGHWEKFGDELFKVTGKSDAQFVMKPMNCPHHTQIFASQARSYRDLPIRYAENGVVYRDEQAGELLGLSRVRAITQDDGHCFCTPEQVEQEVSNIISIIRDFYNGIGMLEDGNYWVSLSVHDPANPEKYMIREDGLFLEAEKILESIAKKEKLPYKRIEGEAAFYGPKLDFQFRDAIGREWQLGTVQLDFSLPERFKLEYTDADGEHKRPVMIHRAIAGALERFLSVYIEHTAGAFPFWLAPIQVVVIPVNTEAHGKKAQEVATALKEAGFRAEYNNNEKVSMGKQVREAKEQKYPYWIIIGDKDIEQNVLTLESRDSSDHQELTLEQVIEKFASENR
ncbi:MAG: threonine--tRNA ligase [Patescibacteria group bacterium]